MIHAPTPGIMPQVNDQEDCDQIECTEPIRSSTLWPEQAAPACLSRAPPDTPPPDGGERIVELCFDDPFPDYDTEPVMAHTNDPDFAA
jgi:hypothetical protein